MALTLAAVNTEVGVYHSSGRQGVRSCYENQTIKVLHRAQAQQLGCSASVSSCQLPYKHSHRPHRRALAHSSLLSSDLLTSLGLNSFKAMDAFDVPLRRNTAANHPLDGSHHLHLQRLSDVANISTAVDGPRCQTGCVEWLQNLKPDLLWLYNGGCLQLVRIRCWYILGAEPHHLSPRIDSR